MRDSHVAGARTKNATNSLSLFAASPPWRITSDTVPAFLPPAGQLRDLLDTTDCRCDRRLLIDNDRPDPAILQTLRPCSTPSVASTESRKQSRTAVVVRHSHSRSPTHVPGALTPQQVRYTSARIQWLGKRSPSNSSPPSPVTAPSDRNQRYTKPSLAHPAYPGLCGLESMEISMS